MLSELYTWQFADNEIKISIWIESIDLSAFNDAIDGSGQSFARVISRQISNW